MCPQFSGGEAADEGGEDDKSQLWSRQASSSQNKSTKKGRRKKRRLGASSSPSALLDTEDVSKMEVRHVPRDVSVFVSSMIRFISGFCVRLLHEFVCVLQILQQAKNLICNIRTPTRSDHERRVRDFSRYMESEMLRVPESSWDECSFTIMNVIRGFKAAQQPAHPALRQPQAYQQVLLCHISLRSCQKDEEFRNTTRSFKSVSF